MSPFPVGAILFVSRIAKAFCLWYSISAYAPVTELADVRDLGSRVSAWGFESLQAHHVGASFVSLAPTFFKSQSALTPLLLLFSRDPLTLGSRLMIRTVRI